MLNISYCPPNISVWDVWVNHGIPQCFMNTVTSSVLAIYILIAGTIQLNIYRRFGAESGTRFLPRGRLYYLQIFLILFIPVLEIVRFILNATVYDDKHIYGYMIVSLVLTTFAFPFSLWVLKVELYNILPSLQPRGHGIVLLLFWTLAFISENLAFINLTQENWWFKLKDLTDQLEMALFILRYIACLLIFFLGLKAPGIVNEVDYYMLGGSQRNVINSMSTITTEYNVPYKFSAEKTPVLEKKVIVRIYFGYKYNLALF